MADPWTLKLPLVGVGDHDRNRILTRWDLLQRDTRIVPWVVAAAWVGIAGAAIRLPGRACGHHRSGVQTDYPGLNSDEADRGSR